jgi:DinB superfamily
MALPFVEANTASRHRLESLVRHLTDDDLARANAYGWTVAALLAHLAFMDGRVLALLRRWKEQGVDYSPLDDYAVNEAAKPLCLALAPRTAVELSLSSAAAVDAQVETVTPELFKEIEEFRAAAPFHFRMNRSLHRNNHLDEIESLLRPTSSRKEPTSGG